MLRNARLVAVINFVKDDSYLPKCLKSRVAGAALNLLDALLKASKLLALGAERDQSLIHLVVNLADSLRVRTSASTSNPLQHRCCSSGAIHLADGSSRLALDERQLAR